MAVLGIDPGMQGGLALRARDWVVVEVLPVRDGELDVPGLSAWISMHRNEIDLAVLEHLQPMPFNGSIGSFKLGQSYGSIKTLLEMLGIPIQLVRPRVWSEAFPHGVTEAGRGKRGTLIKKARKRIVAELFPSLDLREEDNDKTAHEGMTDALLIAEWGHRQRMRGIV